MAPDAVPKEPTLVGHRMQRTVRILGTHGVPAAYGGFETAAENISRYLVDRGWRVIVYCQTVGWGPVTTDTWKGIERVIIPVPGTSWIGNSHFDFISIRHAARFRDLCLTFGYNTAIFNVLQRVRHIPNVINMDGVEWTRARWGPLQRAILWSNEKVARHVADHLVADHPEIARYHARVVGEDKITMIAYGSDSVDDAPTEPIRALGLEPGKYLTLIARPVPENSLLELVRGFSARERGYRLAVLGKLTERDAYHRRVMAAASEEVSFLGAIYDQEVVRALRFHSVAYVHGHTVGGTNPSLVEALGAGNPVIAHDNPYNRWVAGEAGCWFRTAADVDRHLTRLLSSPEELQQRAKAARERHNAHFTWEIIGRQYEELLLRFLPD
jgi:glycosyltransferase involved in cell wall biosynthesis